MPQFIDNNSIFLRDKLKQFLNETEEALFALAFIRQSGLNMLVQEITGLIKRRGRLIVLFGNDFGATQSEAILSLQELGADLRFFSSQQSFHPKGYLFKRGRMGNLIIGSSNLSASGLTTGVEWNISATSDEIEFSHILSEFNRLWTSENAKPITPELIKLFSSQFNDREFNRIIAQEDRIPISTQVLSFNDLLDNSINYITRRRPDTHSTWNFNIYDRKIKQYARQGDFDLVVICDYGTPNEKIFQIPYSYLKENILSNANLDGRNRYLFEVNKLTCIFNWHYSVKMDGRLFLIDHANSKQPIAQTKKFL